MNTSKMSSETGTEHRVYTDGGAYNTGSDDVRGIGSWAFMEPDTCVDGIVHVYGGFVNNTTNNRTEMLAVINAIKSFPQHSVVHVVADSGYVVKGYNHPAYLDKWVHNGWKLSTGKPTMNKDLWIEIVKLSYHYGVKFILIKGHYKDPRDDHAFWNSIVDRACTMIMNEYRMEGMLFDMEFDVHTKKFINVEGKIHEFDTCAGC